MKKLFLSTFVMILFATFMCSSAPAQEQSGADEKCGGPVYKGSEMTRKAVITSKPEPGFTDEARANQVCGTVVISAVLCRTGRVTDVEVVKGLPHGLTERVIDATRRIEFKPAEKDGQPVSQSLRLEYNFNVDGCAQSGELPVPRPGLLVEELVVEGNRRQTDEDILKHISTRPGDPYDPAQMQRDLQTLLALELFDTKQTNVTTLDGERGGVIVVFTVKELPIIRDLTFTGLKSVSETEVLDALRERGTGIVKEGVYNPARVKRAVQVIKELLAERGKPDALVEVRVDQVSSISIALDFFINEKKFRVEPEKKPWRIEPIPLWRKPRALAPLPKRV